MHKTARRDLLLACILIVLVAMFGCYQTVCAIEKTPQRMEKINNMNHWEWPDACIHAIDVTMTRGSLVKSIRNETLDDTIARKSEIQVRYSPDYKLSDVDVTADVSNVEKNPGQAEYQVRLSVPTGEYIGITLYVAGDAVTSGESTDNSGGSGGAADQHAKADNGIVIRGAPTVKGLAAAAAALLVFLLVMALYVVPSMKVIAWNAAEKKKYLDKVRKVK